MDFLKAITLGTQLLEAIGALRKSNDDLCRSCDALRDTNEAMQKDIAFLRNEIETMKKSEGQHGE